MVDRGFVTYTNDAKQQMIGVPPPTIEKYGAVSRETAEAMAKGALAHAQVDLAVSITGIAGPSGAMPGKPIGLVHFAAAARSGRLIHHDRKFGDLGRSEVRRKSVLQAMAMLRELAETGRATRAALSRNKLRRDRSRRLGARTPRQSGGTRHRTSSPSTAPACGF